MAEYAIRLPAAWRNGIDDPAALEDISVDRGFTRNVKQNLLIAKFGDGYEQRVGNGINTKQEKYNVSFKNRSVTEVNKIAEFLDAYIGKNFDFRVTNHSGTEVLKVICETYNIAYTNTEVHSLSATLRRVYEP